MLKINVSKSFNNRLILDNLEYVFEDKGLYWLSGKSGCGKTTLFNVISNRCDYKGEVIADKEIFFLSLNDYLIENFTVKENVELHRDIYRNFKEYKDEFDIKKLLHIKVSKLSLGERQRVGLFIALSSGCEIILLDEIFAGVDEKFKKIFLSELKKVSKDKLIVLSSHEPIKNYDKKLNLINGKIINKNHRKKDIVNKENKRSIKNEFKWANILHGKQIYSRFVFIVSLLALICGFTNMENEIFNLKYELDKSFNNEKSMFYLGNVGMSSTVSYRDFSNLFIPLIIFLICGAISILFVSSKTSLNVP